MARRARTGRAARGQFADIQQNRAVDYLPDSADSTQVARDRDELPGGESTDLVLVGMRERARSVGGTLDAGPRTGGGFEVRAVLPLTTTGERAG
ncbi:hypothetical protein ACIP39_18185 [Streptomyces tibetensis]|uniref:hypothetical protein n=1 Tax=Streptomyces tibetensis TaxID=2382123 RepID=UPI0038285E29